MNLGTSYGYFGVFLVSLIGGISIFLPVPDSLVVFTLAGLRVGDTWLYEASWIAVAAALGSVLGEFSGYVLGLGGRKAFTKRFGKNLEFLESIIKKFGSLAIFIFALTPLPDDLIFIPLGIMRYNVIKAFVPAFIGKLCMSFLVAYGGRFFIESIRDMFGAGNDWLTAIVSTVLGVAAFIVLIKVDWQKRFGKYFSSHS